MFFTVTNLNTSYSLDKVNEEFVKYVKKSKKDYEDIKQLHDYLIKPAKNKRERAELFFYWISQHIEYDIDKYESAIKGERVEEYSVLTEKKGVCEDFSRFFKALCDISEIECYYIVGYSKGGSYQDGKELKIDHAWNIIKLEQEYEFVDCTWGSGELVTDPDGNRKYRKDFDLSQVFVNSNDFRKSRLPGSAKWQLLEHPVSYEAFVENTEFDEMHQDANTVFNFRDSIRQFNSLLNDFKPIQERIDAYRFNPTTKNAMECGKSYEIAAYALSKGEYDLDHINKAISYFEESKKYYVAAFKKINKDQDKPDRNQIEIIKKVNKRIKNCEFRIMSRT